MQSTNLSLGQAAALLAYPLTDVTRLIECGRLETVDVDGEQRLTVKGISRFVGISAEPQAVDAVVRVLDDDATWERVFGEPYPPTPYALLHTVAGDTRTALRRAVEIAGIHSA